MRTLFTALFLSVCPALALATPATSSLSDTLVEASWDAIRGDFTKNITVTPVETQVVGNRAFLRVVITQADGSPIDTEQLPVVLRGELRLEDVKGEHAELFLTKGKDGWEVKQITSAQDPYAGVTPDLCISFSKVIYKGVCEKLGWSKDWTTPKRGSALRRELLNLVRPAATEAFDIGVEFVVRSMRVTKDRAYLNLDAQRPGGEPIVMEHTPLAAQGRAYGGPDLEALLKKVNGKWQVEHLVVSPTDVWWADPALCKDYGSVLTSCRVKKDAK